ncbi:MAG: hypothetical protein JNM72_16750 [Deltaproteobacteria bacterium]|nr:hypothetical protein [Deltaproteobacteria bacterium]
MRHAALLLSLGIAACGGKSDDTGASGADLDAYVASVCRVSSIDSCDERIYDNCAIYITFDTEAECASFYGLVSQGCPGALTWIEEHPAEVSACIEAYDSLDCATDTFCDETGEQSSALQEACGPVEAGIDEGCGR